MCQFYEIKLISLTTKKVVKLAVAWLNYNFLKNIAWLKFEISTFKKSLINFIRIKTQLFIYKVSRPFEKIF